MRRSGLIAVLVALAMMPAACAPQASLDRISWTGAGYINDSTWGFLRPEYRIVFENEQLDDEALRAVMKDLRRVKPYKINLDRTKVTNGVVGELSRIPGLKVLTLTNTNVTGAGLREVDEATSIEMLYVDAAKSTAEEERATEQRIPGLKVYRLDANRQEVKE